MRLVQQLAWILVVSGIAIVYYTVFRVAPLPLQEERICKSSEEVRVKLSKYSCTAITKRLSAMSLKKKVDEKIVMRDAGAMLKCPWHGDKTKTKYYRSVMKQCCNASDWLIVTKENAPLGQNIIYETQKHKKINVTTAMFKRFPKTSPLPRKVVKSCAVVGNSAILSGSCCGREIDKNDFVIRFNVPPLLNYTNDAGKKVHLVTVNPSILSQRFHNLNHGRKAFGVMMQSYGDALILMPVFSFTGNTEVSFKVQYTLEDFGLASKMVSFHPVYLQKLAQHWKTKGLKVHRLSSGFMLVSAALELCNTITLYGFWPFSTDWKGSKLRYHYYDKIMPNKAVHSMPKEFLIYSQMHIDGALRLHVGPCFST